MTDFHFLTPEWFLLLIPATLLFYLLSKRKTHNKSNWDQIIAPALLQHLLIKNSQEEASLPKWLLLLGFLLGISALANPVWEKKPAQVYQTPRALVLILDLSASMNAADLQPSRIVQTRLKIQDILDRDREGLTGLVVFAGDAFSVTPLTRDRQTIESQLRVLEPSIMPVQGSRADLGLNQAAELLQQAGIKHGDILLLADGFESEQSIIAAANLRQAGHRVSVIGAATPAGAPISNGQGDVMRDRNNVPVLAKLDEAAMQRLANKGGGIYHPLTIDNRDLELFFAQPALDHARSSAAEGIMQNQWHERGPFLTLLLLPLAALAFRKGWLMIMLPVLVLPVPQPAMAFAWQDLWQTQEQQASEALQQQQMEKARTLSSDPAIKATALYRQQKYTDALAQYEQLQDADAHYNRGNTLARMQQYTDAIEAYDNALAIDPAMQDAIDNKKAIEDMLQQQEQKQQQEKQKQSADSNNEQQNSADKASQNPQDEQQSDNSSQQQNSNNTDNPQDNNNDTPPDNNTQSGEQNSGQTDNSAAQQNQAKAQEQSQPEQPGNDAAEQQKPQNITDAESQPQPLSNEEDMAAEQWLRRIPDDPGGLLKRKFLYQYQQRDRQPPARQAW